jgi:ribosome-associated protein YbcJ (S4-like RNA binding protein)
VNKIAQGDLIKTIKILRVGGKAKQFKGGQADFEKYLKPPE